MTNRTGYQKETVGTDAVIKILKSKAKDKPKILSSKEVSSLVETNVE